MRRPQVVTDAVPKITVRDRVHGELKIWRGQDQIIQKALKIGFGMMFAHSTKSTAKWASMMAGRARVCR